MNIAVVHSSRELPVTPFTGRDHQGLRAALTGAQVLLVELIDSEASFFLLGFKENSTIG